MNEEPRLEEVLDIELVALVAEGIVDAPCRYLGHAPWVCFNPGGKVVCGICHPSPREKLPEEELRPRAADRPVSAPEPPVDLDRRCHLCRKPGAELEGEGGDLFCAHFGACKRRTLRRLGVGAARQERTPSQGEASGSPIAALEPKPAEPDRRFCLQHRSYFCPCVAAHLYRDSKARW